LTEYLRKEQLKPTLVAMRHAIKELGKGIQEYATQSYVGYKHSGGRQFAYIKVYRTSVEIGAHVIDDKHQLLGYDGMRIETPGEDYSGALEKIKTAFVNLGGHLLD